MRILTLLFVFIPLLNHAQNSRIDDLAALALKIQNDPTGKDVLYALKPTMEDYQGLFQTVQDVGDAWMYTEDAYLDLDDKPIVIGAEYSEIKVYGVLAGELKRGVDSGLPEGYTDISNRMKPNAKIYAIEYLIPKEEETIQLHLFFHVNNRWVFIPMAYKAFE